MARILLIEDNVALAETLTATMRLSGHDVTQAAIGAAAWDSLKGETYDLIITDLNMPGLDGMAIGLWARSFRPGVPIIAISGRPDELETAAQSGVFAATLAKPIRRRVLIDTIDQVIHGNMSSRP